MHPLKIAKFAKLSCVYLELHVSLALGGGGLFESEEHI